MNFSDLKGQKVLSIDEDYHHGRDDGFCLITDKGQYVVIHSQECCEHVWIEDITGDLKDLIGEEILLAEEVSSEDEKDEDLIWTFYKIQTMHGDVTIRWCANTNSYYGTEVEFHKIG